MRALADGGVLLTSRAVEAGWPRRSLTRALRAEGWTRLRQGAWAEPGRDPDLLAHLRAVLLREPRLIVSHGSAAALWRIEMLWGGHKRPLEFIDPQLTVRGVSDGVRVHRMPLSRRDVVERQGLRLTTPTRTLADLRPESQAELRTPDGGRRVVDFLFRAAGLAASSTFCSGRQGWRWRSRDTPTTELVTPIEGTLPASTRS